jgi:hypothetical protein
MTDAFDHDGLFALVALSHRSVRESKAQNRYISYVASQMDSWSCLVIVYVLALPLRSWPSRKREVMAEKVNWGSKSCRRASCFSLAVIGLEK